MANRFELNHPVLRDLEQSPEVMAALRAVGERLVSATGKPADYEIQEWVGRNRARVTVRTTTHAAAAREARDHTLVAALGSVARG